MPQHIEVVGAVIVRDGSVLCAQRGPSAALPYLWEFPGGKVEPDESPRDALEREISEELRCRVRVGDQVERTTYAYDFATITLTTYYCELVGGEPQPTEHAEVRWVAPQDLEDLDWAPADVPAVARIQLDLADG
ncbi:MAG: (deoxy)nucleoside triphosphate pyrophosphohydrolase [Solirubrobacteraceae bacterium]|nr:(deoxy)nucleoside triphosphate pyrophosphohydrolase [Solirubrobacteraceae bacterium]